MSSGTGFEVDRDHRPLERPGLTFRWVTSGSQPSVRVTADGALVPLETDLHPELGDPAFPTALTTHAIRLGRDERLLLLSDSLSDDAGLGLAAIQQAVAKADDGAAPATLRAIEDALRESHPDALDDDATLIVLTPSGMIGPAG